MTSPVELQTRTVAEAIPYNASKWLHHQVLIDEIEMQALNEALGDFQMFTIGTVLPVEQGKLEKADFLKIFGEYVGTLREGKLPQEATFRIPFSSVFTRSPDHLFALQIDGGQHIIRIQKPVVQIQAHSMDYSGADKSFRSMVFGRNTITWGLQFSYPQLFLHPETQDVEKVDESERFPNTSLFKTLLRWLRNETVPVAFEIEKEKINTSMRLGKNCLGWINQHPQLVEKKIRVANQPKTA